MMTTGAVSVAFQHPLPFLLSMCSGFAVNALAMLVISLASALTLKVRPAPVCGQLPLSCCRHPNR